MASGVDRGRSTEVSMRCQVIAVLSKQYRWTCSGIYSSSAVVGSTLLSAWQYFGASYPAMQWYIKYPRSDSSVDREHQFRIRQIVRTPRQPSRQEWSHHLDQPRGYTGEHRFNDSAGCAAREMGYQGERETPR